MGRRRRLQKHVRVMDMTDEMRRKCRYTHLWKTISKGQTAAG